MPLPRREELTERLFSLIPEGKDGYANTVKTLAAYLSCEDLDRLTRNMGYEDEEWECPSCGRKFLVSDEDVDEENCPDSDCPSHEPESCECDNTHEQNNTVCRWCYSRGRRQWTDPEVSEDNDAEEV